ncbi:glycosyltransferase [Ketobacter nezhaii]|uniref:glycosyltransferase n=1 Tax=Ketobacter sp. MCCC 1A13808 TaxID=2602738 RepID=UPI0018DD4DDE|nr:glycosyltransferase [Ketobacter sp. MCCC 1A13808]
MWATLTRVFRLVLDGVRQSGFESHNQWLQRNGLKEAGTASSVFSSSHIVIIGALDLPQCRRYRVMQKAELFRGRGCRVSVHSYKECAEAIDAMQTCTVLLLYRVPDGKDFRCYIAEARRLGVRIYYDIDDPIFDRTVYEKNKNLDTLTASERSHLLAESDLYLRAMGEVDVVIVSTDKMAQLAKSSGISHVHVWPNVIDKGLETLIQSSDGPDPVAAAPVEKAVVIGYMSGSRAHDADLAEVAGVLENILKLKENVLIRFCGFGVLPENLVQFSSRIQRHPFTGYKQYLSALSSVDINMVPLVVDEFNECKSAIRFLEASLVGVPTVASAVGEFRSLIENNVSGILATSPQQWQDALLQLIESPQQRAELVKEARILVCEVRHINTIAFALLPTLNDMAVTDV